MFHRGAMGRQASPQIGREKPLTFQTTMSICLESPRTASAAAAAPPRRRDARAQSLIRVHAVVAVNRPRMRLTNTAMVAVNRPRVRGSGEPSTNHPRIRGSGEPPTNASVPRTRPLEPKCSQNGCQIARGSGKPPTNASGHLANKKWRRSVQYLSFCSKRL